MQTLTQNNGERNVKTSNKVDVSMKHPKNHLQSVPYRMETQIAPSVDPVTLSHNRRVKQLAPKDA